MDTPIALTVAGSDSSGGAGIQADLKTFARLKVYGLSVVTAVTAQNTCGVLGVFDVPAEFVSRQLEAVLTDSPPKAMKTGMLACGASVEAVATAIRRYQIGSVVVDPVLVSTSGTPLLEEQGIESFKRSLLPQAILVTPNLAEAERLTGQPVGDLPSMERAAQTLRGMGARHVLVKGGHLPGEPIDVFFDGAQFRHLRAPRVAANTHGTGCVLSAAITSYLAHGRTIYDAVQLGKEFITEALRNGVSIGHGSSILPL